MTSSLQVTVWTGFHLRRTLNLSPTGEWGEELLNLQAVEVAKCGERD